MNDIPNLELINIFKNEYIVKLNQYDRLNITVSVNNAMPSILSNHTLSKLKNLLYLFKFNLASIFNLIYILFLPKINLSKDIFIISDIRQYRKEFKNLNIVRVGLYNFREFKYIHILQNLNKWMIIKTILQAFNTYNSFKNSIKHYTINEEEIDLNIFIKIVNISLIRYIDILLTIKVLTKNNTINYHFGSHFDIYVSILSMLRKKEKIKYLEGNQHGLFELSRSNLTYNKFYVDKYNLLFEESKEYFLNKLNGNTISIIEKFRTIKEKYTKKYVKKNKKLIIFAMQNDNYKLDENILKKLLLKYDDKKYILLCYVHPAINYQKYLYFVDNFKSVVFEKTNRYANIDLLYTRYSTIGIEYINIYNTEVYFIESADKVCIFKNKKIKVISL